MPFTNYIAFEDGVNGRPRIGHLDLKSDKIQPLSFISGTPISDLYQVIEAGAENIAPAGEAVSASSVKVLPPISGRDILAVGKNYAEHAKEFNTSGYDSSDKVDIPTHPVIFTKRSTSIIANGEDIFPHPGFTESVDYEGEIGVIIGKAGFQIQEKDAMDYVWGFTNINDMTARERQRDHKQFYIGKSPDTFCPIGPIAVPAKDLPKVLTVQTHVNGELRQNATTDDLIFSIPFLIKTISEGMTLQPGDVIATGTPAGVGIGKKPPVFLKSGDEVTVSVTGLGKLTNKIASPTSTNYEVARVQAVSSLTMTNSSKTVNGKGLTKINGKLLNYQTLGKKGGHPIVFVHGLGGTSEYWRPLIGPYEQSCSIHLFDLEGHGLSPTSPLSVLSITSFAADLKGVFDHAGINSGATLIAHSMGCLIAMSFAISNPTLVKDLVLMGPPPSPLPEAGSKGAFTRAEKARTQGMSGVTDDVTNAGTSSMSKKVNQIGIAAIRLSLLGQDPEGYAKACTALAGATTALPVEKIQARSFIVTGDEDKVSPPDLCKKYATRLRAAPPVVLEGTGHWHVFEKEAELSTAVSQFLSS